MNRHERRRAKATGDAAFEHGIRFHVVPQSQLTKGQIGAAWDAPANEPTMAIVSLAKPWPESVRIDRITAVFVKSKDELDEAIAFIGACKHGLRH